MIIRSVNIVAFGKLKNCNLNFGDGVNVLQNANGFGKSTVASFIRAMLFGLNYTSRLVDGARVNDVTRFMPWDSTQRFGGSMVVYHNGENYLVERFFGTTAKQQTLSVTAQSTGQKLNVTEVGEYFLGLTADSYDRSTYYPQEAVEISSNENFDARLANFVENGEYDYDTVCDKLRAYRKNLKYERGNGGEIYALEQQIYSLQNQLLQYQNRQNAKAQIQREGENISLRLGSLREKQSQMQRELDALQQQLYQSQPSEADLERIKKIQEVNARIATVPKSVTEDHNKVEELTHKLSNMQSQRKKLSKRAKCAIAFGVIFVAIVATLLVLSQFVWAGVAGVMGTVLSILVVQKQPANPTEKDIEGVRDEILQLIGRYLYVADKTFEENLKAFWGYCNDYQMDLLVKEALGDLPASQGNQQQITSQIEGCRIELNSITAQIKDCEFRLHQIGFELSQEEQTTSVEIAERLLEAQHKLEIAKSKYQIATLTTEILTSAKQNLSSAYLPKLCQSCQSLLTAITGERYNVIADGNFAVSLTYNGVTKPLGAFSRGIREITLLCFRIALSQLLYDGNIPFLIVDDAFVNFDEQNFARATQLLKQLSAKTQVIYFTCHNRLGNL